MKRMSLRKGMVFLCINKHWQLNRRLINDKLQFESSEGDVLNLTNQEFLKRWESGEWQVDTESLSLSEDSIYLVTPADLSTFPLKWQESAIRKSHYINALNPESIKYNTDLWREIIQKTSVNISDTKPPSPSTVYLWWKNYRVTKSVLSLMPRKMSGYTKKEDARYAIFEDIIKTNYLNAQQLPVIDVVYKIQQRITLLNMGRPQENKIKQISPATIYRWVKNLRSDIRDSSRLGANVARNKYRTVMGGFNVHQVLERIEIDHTPLDLLIFEKITHLPLGRPWLTLAIDKYSRMIVGYYLSFNPPSAFGVLQCIKQMILPKNKLLERFPDIKNDWPAYGIPSLIAVDNGMDLHSDAFKKSCLELGIEILYCPAGTPEMKGSIERMFRTLNQGLIHKIPGTVFSNINERGDYPSEELATIDLETLVHLLTKWIVDVYNISPHRGISDTPLNKWSESAKELVIELPAYPTQLDVITGIPAKRTVFHYGIELERLHYNNRPLQELRRISGENLIVEVKFYEDQVAYIDVFDPFQKEYLRVEAVNQDYVNNLHREAHRLSLVQARKKFGEQYSMPQLAEARVEIENIIKDAMKSKKMGDRKKGANLLMHDSIGVFNSSNPVQEAIKPVLKRKILKVPDPLESGLDDDLPDVIRSNVNNQNTQGA